MRRAVCIVSPGNLASNPRVLKEAEALHGAGYEVTAVVCDYNEALRLADDEIEAAVRTGLTAFNARAKGSGGKVARAMVLADPPDVHAGEITDKGYIAQSLARTHRAAAVERLFADPAPQDVMVFS